MVRYKAKVLTGGILMKKLFVKIIAAAMAVTLLTVPLSGCRRDDDRDGYTVGILQHFAHPALDAAIEGFISGMADEGFIEGENITFIKHNAVGDMGNSNMMAGLLVEADVDLLLGVSTPSSQSMRNATEDIPIVFTAITDPIAAGLAATAERPGSNLTGMSDWYPVTYQFEFLLELFPDTQTIGILYNSGEANSVVQANRAAEAAAEMGLAYVRRTVTGTVDVPQMASALANDVDVIFVPTCNTVAQAMPAAVNSASALGVPIISADPGGVAGGAIASKGLDYYVLGRETAVMAAQILRGEADPATMPVQWLQQITIAFNLTTANELGIDFPASILDTATVPHS